MIGAIIGDIVGSRFEFHNHKSKEFDLLADESVITDDTVMTIAIADALLKAKDVDLSHIGDLAIDRMRYWGNQYLDVGYGGMFKNWLKSDNPMPYKSFGNGAAMRVSPCGIAATDEDMAEELSYRVTMVTHNHLESVKAAEAVSLAILWARKGYTKDNIQNKILLSYYPIDFTLDEIRDKYRFDVTCQGSVPQAFEAFFDAVDFIDTIRNAVSIGGDSDTIACIAGSMAWEYYKAQGELTDNDYSLWHECYRRIPSPLRTVVDEFIGEYE